MKKFQALLPTNEIERALSLASSMNISFFLTLFRFVFVLRSKNQISIKIKVEKANLRG